MLKTTAISLLGGSIREAAKLLNLTTQAVSKWAEEGPMSRPVSDRVLAHLVREACKRDPALRAQMHIPADALALPPEPIAKDGNSFDEAAAAA